MRLSPSTVDALHEFVTGRTPPDAFDRFLIAAMSDDMLTADERGALESLRMSVIECGESSRTLDELKDETRELLAIADPTSGVESSRRFIETAPLVIPHVEITSSRPAAALG